MFFRYNFRGILWAIFIFILSGIPSSQLPSNPAIEHFDKFVHVFLYAQLEMLLITGFIKQYQFRILKRKALFYAFIIAFVYGIMIEIFQKYLFLGRSMELGDILANICGTIFGILGFLLIYGKPSK